MFHLGTIRITHAFFADSIRQDIEGDWRGTTARVVLQAPWVGMSNFTTQCIVSPGRGGTAAGYGARALTLGCREPEGG